MKNFTFSCTKCGEDSCSSSSTAGRSVAVIVRLGVNGGYYRGRYNSHTGGVEITVDNSKNNSDVISNSITVYHVQFANRINGNAYAATEIYCDGKATTNNNNGGVGLGGGSGDHSSSSSGSDSMVAVPAPPSAATGGTGTTRRNNVKRKKSGGCGGGSNHSSGSSTRNAARVLDFDDVADMLDLENETSITSPPRHCAPKGIKVSDSIKHTMIKGDNKIPMLNKFLHKESSTTTSTTAKKKAKNKKSINDENKNNADDNGIGCGGNSKKNAKKNNKKNSKDVSNKRLNRR